MWYATSGSIFYFYLLLYAVQQTKDTLFFVKLFEYTANEMPMRIKYKCQVPIDVFQKWNFAASLFPKQNYNILSPSFHIHVSMSSWYFPRISLPILLQPNRQTYSGNISMAHRHMNVGTGNETAQFHFWGIHKSNFRYSVGGALSCLVKHPPFKDASEMLVSLQ